jgi:succinate dehydrogenase/fumarate reductase flavoprotein subunit
MTTNSNLTRHDLVKAHNNGYPNFTGLTAYTGFETFEQAEAFANEVGGKLHSIYNRNGQSLPESRGQVWSAYTAEDYVNDLGDNYSIETLDSIEDAIKWADSEEQKLNFEEIRDEILKCKENEVVVSGYGKYCETIESTLIRYHEDVHNWEIGVVVDENNNQDDE